MFCTASEIETVISVVLIQDVISLLTSGTSLCQALDCFTAMLSRPESRLRMAEIIGSKLNISKEKVFDQPALEQTSFGGGAFL